MSERPLVYCPTCRDEHAEGAPHFANRPVATPEEFRRIEELERDLRREWWANHGHGDLYGDDGEMQCHRCPADFKREDIAVLRDIVRQSRLAALTEEQNT